MTADAQLVKSSRGPDFIALDVARVLWIAFASMTRRALRKDRCAGYLAALVMASRALGTRSRPVREFSVGIEICLVWFVSEADHAACALQVELLDLRGCILALGLLRIAVTLLRRLLGSQHGGRENRHEI